MKEYPCEVCGGTLTVLMCQSGIRKDGVNYPAHVACADEWASQDITVFKVSSDGGSSYVEESPACVMDMIAAGDDNESYTIRKKTMKRAEYESLPEFEGF